MHPEHQAKLAAAVERKKRPPAVHVEAAYTNIEGAKRITGWGATTIWSLIKAKELRVVRFGQRGKYAGRTTIEVASIYEAIARRAVKATEAQAGK
jgi:hypothetical protein